MSENKIDYYAEYYHGSNVIVNEPKIIKGRLTKDFGRGFYITNIFSQAKKWAIRQRGDNAISIYRLHNCEELKIKVFKTIDKEWLDFIAKCRADISHEYDVVEGPMADDKVYNRVNEYLNNEISEEEFLIICKFQYLTHQIVLCTEKAIEKLEFKEGIYVK
ncbi:MAG: DUF3990 domain-containing protein [Sarcina sp.]